MMLLDANLLLYAYDSSSEHHERARKWLQRVLSQPEPVALAWTTILAFLRISTHPRALQRSFSIAEAASIVSGWLAVPALRILPPGEQHWAILSALLAEGQARGPLVMNAHLAALAIEHGATLCTTDRDFARFRELRVVNPLESSVRVW
jgi:hypothetical protein